MAVRDLYVLCSAVGSRQDWVGSFMGCKINYDKFLVRYATSSGISRACGLTCHRHSVTAVLLSDPKVWSASE